MSLNYKTDLDRLLDSIIIDSNGCWIWQFKPSHGGYGKVTVNRKTKRAHIWSYELYKGKVPDGLKLDHKCRVRLCVNPDHLEAVTHAVNMDRSPLNKKYRTRCKK